VSGKRDDDSQADLEVGMTTAERRRRRRRGGGLRVPSDNVPRRTNPPVVAPVPEDPSLAMSIAYSFAPSADSEPIPRVASDDPSGPRYDMLPPERAPSVIDPPVPSATPSDADFEMKTREMNAVNLEDMGIEGSPGATDPHMPVFPSAFSIQFNRPPETGDRSSLISQGLERIERAERRERGELSGAQSPMELEGDQLDPIDTDTGDSIPNLVTEPEVSSGPVSPLAAIKPKRERLKTVALSEDDLEEVREAVRGVEAQQAASSPPPSPGLSHHHGPPPPPPAREKSPSDPHQMLGTRPPAATVPSLPPLAVPLIVRTQQLSALDIEVVRDSPSSPEIEIQEIERAAESGDIEVDMGEDEPVKRDVGRQTLAPTPASSLPSIAPLPRVRPPSVPPALGPLASQPIPPIHATPPPTPAVSTTIPPPIAAHGPTPTVPPPLPPQVQHKPPPAPPPAPKKEERAPTSSRPRSTSDRMSSRAKPWFVDLFDEDYLRTLPFLTPQATQAEAEFVIDAMGLTPGAQVLDVGCGYGRHAMELAARGFHVVGLDISTPLLIRGGEEAHRRGLQINFVRGDMRELDFEAQFDGAYCLFSTFGYFDDEMNKKAIANIARALKPGGRVLLEILNRDYLITDLPTRVWWEGDGCVVLEEVELNYFSSRIQVNRSVVFDDGRQLEQEISVRAYSLHEVGKLMHAAGFRVLEVSGGYHTRSRFFGNQSRHIIVLAERKDAATSSSG
jgi:SAM-dependent methyltransferase